MSRHTAHHHYRPRVPAAALESDPGSAPPPPVEPVDIIRDAARRVRAILHNLTLLAHPVEDYPGSA